jgi:hypothetical protein
LETITGAGVHYPSIYPIIIKQMLMVLQAPQAADCIVQIPGLALV